MEIGDDTTHPITQIGKVPLSMQDGQTKYLKDVLHVPTITKNLVSVGQMVEQGLQVTFNPNGRFVECRSLTLAKCGVEAQHLEKLGFGVVRDSRMFRAQQQGSKHSHWGVLGVIRKILKRRYRKCPRIGNSDIYSPSYGQKKGRESNWQFDS